MAAAENVKPKRSLPQLPQLTTPQFSGGKLASIRKKIDDKQFLLSEGIPPQIWLQLEQELFKHPHGSVDYFRPRTSDKPIATTQSIPIAAGPSGKSVATLDKKDDKNITTKESITCEFCGRSYPAERLQLHQRACKNAAEKLRKVPFIVKLGLRHVDKESSYKEITEKPDDDEQHVENVLVSYEEAEPDEGHENGDELEPETYEMDRNESEVDLQFPGGGNNWTDEHERYMKHLEEAKETMKIYASGTFHGIPPPPGPDELEVEYVQCPSCLRRFSENYNAYDHLIKCNTKRAYSVK